jgi:AraC-like DNA-binding protein/mannose-6-phosphate isomerase-like protein (cupin superfamily)
MEKIRKAEGFENQYLFVIKEAVISEYKEDPLFEAAIVTDIGYFPHAQYHYRYRETGSEQAIVMICIAGRGKYRALDGEMIDLLPGNAVIIPANQPHEYMADTDSPWSVYWFHIYGSLIESYCQMININQPILLDPDMLSEIQNNFHRCFNILKKPVQREGLFAVSQYATGILAAIGLASKAASLKITAKGGEAVDQAIAFMKENLHRGLTLAEIAAAANFSPSHLYTLFKHATGHAPVDYFIQMKMQSASKQLYFTNKTIKEISGQFGIYDSCYFSRLFKKTMGMAPSDYRNLSKG